MSFIVDYLKARRKSIILFVIFGLLFVLSAVLYNFPFQYVGYPLFLCMLIGLIYMCWDAYNLKRKKDQLNNIIDTMLYEIEDIPLLAEGVDEPYIELINNLTTELASKQSTNDIAFNDMVDYFTTWAHQIKTPIASIRVNLQNEDSSFARLVASELNRVEQYVEMVLTYLRLDSDYSDYVFKTIDLDFVVKSSIKRYRQDFISRKLGINLSTISKTVTTDEKWLSFVIEQILSNALKYTSSGSISIYMSSENTLCIEDTGMGIEAQDIPRVFDKGYTGINGRVNKSASGLGLYLCGQICKKLGIKISIDSIVGQGTKVYLEFLEKNIVHE
ncbi:MAG: sensor histidine kinase [Clostridia bacterium]|nr:sensor histidine kinase [Clostridia bacterium]